MAGFTSRAGISQPNYADSDARTHLDGDRLRRAKEFVEPRS